MKSLWTKLFWTAFLGSFLLLTACGGTPPSEEEGMAAATSGALTTMISPTPGSTLSDSATFTWTNTGATSYALWIGSSAGRYNIYSKILAGTSTTASNLPLDGSTIYVRLFDQIGGVWTYNDYTYIATSNTTPVLTTPAAGTTFASNAATFGWSGGTPAAAEYALWIGSAPGGYDIWARSLGTSTTVDVAGLPLDGRDLYARLFYRYGSSWYHAPDVLYHSFTNTTTYVITSPANGSALTGSSQLFSFTSGAADYGLWVGSGVGKYDYFAKASTAGVASVTATNLPVDGSTVYVRFWYELGTTWYSADYTYTAWTASSQGIITPVAGTTLASSSVMFTWAGGADEYAMWVGSAVGTYDIWARSSLGTSTSVVATKLPKDGSAVYVRFFYRFGASWYHKDTTYTSCTGACSAKVLSFAPAVNYGAGNGPQWVATGDFNGDNKPDFAVVNYNDKNVSILLGNGDGTFQAAVNYALGSGPVAVVTGDFNGDTKTDLAIAKYATNNVAVLFGNGDGTFQAAVNYAAGTSPTSLTAGDFNGDTKTDLATSNQGSNNASVLLNTGTGTFAAAVAYGAGTAPTSIATGDFNGDTKADLAVTNYTSNDVSILLGNGDGTFAAASAFGAGTAAYSVTIEDFNGDTKMDLAVANYTSNDVSILLGNGDGTFAAAVSYAAGTGCYTVTNADFNGDGKKDLAVANGGSDNLSVLLGNGDGTFQAAVNYGAGTGVVSVAIGDFNGDGKSDLAATNYSSNNVSVLLNTSQ